MYYYHCMHCNTVLINAKFKTTHLDFCPCCGEALREEPSHAETPGELIQLVPEYRKAG